MPILYGLTAFFGDDPDDLEKIDIWDESLWKLCNPSLGKHLSMRNVRMEAMAAKKSEAAERLFRWLRLNQWITTKSVGWISLNLYDKTQWGPSKKAAREEFLHQLDGMICYGGCRPVDEPRSDSVGTALSSTVWARHRRDLALWHLETGSNG